MDEVVHFAEFIEAATAIYYVRDAGLVEGIGEFREHFGVSHQNGDVPKLRCRIARSEQFQDAASHATCFYSQRFIDLCRRRRKYFDTNLSRMLETAACDQVPPFDAAGALRDGFNCPQNLRPATEIVVQIDATLRVIAIRAKDLRLGVPESIN